MGRLVQWLLLADSGPVVSSPSHNDSHLLPAQISSGTTAPPPNTGVKIPTCKFSMRETFLTSPAELYRVFLNQEVRPQEPQSSPWGVEPASPWGVEPASPWGIEPISPWGGC